MKKSIKTLIMVIVMLFTIMPISKATFEAHNTITPQNANIGDTVTYTLTTNSNVVAANFEITYPADQFELIGSGTTNLNVAVKNGKIACIYADLTGTGTKEFKVNFKAKAEVSNASFSISNYKLREVNASESYTELSLETLENISVKKQDPKPSEEEPTTPVIKPTGTVTNTNPTTTTTTTQTSPKPINATTNNEVKDATASKKAELPKTGSQRKTIFIVSMFIILSLGLFFKSKYKKLNNLLN